MTAIQYVRRSPAGDNIYGAIFVLGHPEAVEEELSNAIIESREAVLTAPDNRKIRINPKQFEIWRVCEAR